MSQHDMDVANQAGAAFRADMNAALQALASTNSGATEPAVPFAYQLWADTSAGILKMRNGANTAWVKLGLLGVANLGHILPGSIVYHAKNTVPAGYLKANGAAVSRTTYADLFAEIGTTFGVGDGSNTFNLPELRAEFVRGWDDSRGVDSGRGFGTYQDDALKNHQHSTNDATAGAVNYGNDGTGLSRNNVTGITSTTSGQLTSVPINMNFSETRPRNVALLACIKY